MSQGFSGQNLRGRSFRGQDLTGANFSHSDIQGADFTNTILIGANFSHAKAGLQQHFCLFLIAVSLVVSAISGAATRMAGSIAISMSKGLESQSLHGIVLVVVLTVLAILFLFIALRGLTVDLLAVFVAVASALVVVGAVWLAVASAKFNTGNEGLQLVMRTAWALAGTLPWAFAGVLAGALAGTLPWILAETLFGILIEVLALTGVWILGWVLAGEIFKAVSDVWTWSVITSVTVAGVLLASYVSWRALSVGDEKFALIRRFAIVLAATGGTSFRGADLTDADFTQATLKSTNFTGATLTGTRWYQAKKLDRARVDDSLLTESAVRDLLVSGNGYKKSYVGVNLKGANLAGANLNQANLREADLSEARLQGANLERANLTKVQAIGADFSSAYLTGACLESWNIDSTTKLERVDCQYVYLLQGQRERRPSSGEFKPGEFTKLFQEVLDTVDLIFRNGVDWKAFMAAFKTVQMENEDADLAIQSIENKGDGVVVVKVSVPPDANKEKIHSDFIPNYEFALRAIEEKYQAQLDVKDDLIESYRQQLEDSRQRERQQNANMKEIISLLALKPDNVPVNVPEVKAIAERQSLAKNLVILTLGSGDFEHGFPSVTAQIWTTGDRLPTQCLGQLPPAPEIPQVYSRWQPLYNSLGLVPRITILPNQVTNISNTNKNDIYPLAEELEEQLNQWLNSDTFRPIDKSLREKFVRSDEVSFIIQSENTNVRRLPWHLWDFFKSYRKAEVALSAPFYDRVEKTAPLRTKKRLLAILGDSTGINIEEDCKVLENLNNAETVFLVQPTRNELDKHLWDEQGWDILCFSGHSSSQWDGRNGWIYINQTEKLTIEQLENALLAAIERGLQLAIFNSCNGLGLAKQLACLHIPQIIVMRAPVPDVVAQEFLKNFLRAFASGKSFYLAVRQAREMLQGLENDFPCATWLPVICQNPAEEAIAW